MLQRITGVQVVIFVIYSTSKENPLKKVPVTDNPLRKSSTASSSLSSDRKTEKAGQKRKSALDEIMEVSLPWNIRMLVWMIWSSVNNRKFVDGMLQTATVVFFRWIGGLLKKKNI